MITRHRALILDADGASAATAAALVVQLGHDARIAADPTAAVEVARGFDPDLLIVSLGEPPLEPFLVGMRSAARRPLYVAGLVEWQHRCLDEMRFDYVIAKPVRAHALRQLLWHVEVRQSSRVAATIG